MLQPKPKAKVKATPDSTKILMKKQVGNNSVFKKEIQKTFTGERNPKLAAAHQARIKTASDILRQANKGKAGYDKNGYSLKK